jgi:primosomal protein N''
MDELYERLNRKLNSLTQQNAQQNSPQSRHKKHVHEKENRVVNFIHKFIKYGVRKISKFAGGIELCIKNLYS